MGGGAHGACAVDSRGRGQASWGATLALPLSPFAEQLALGFNPSPAAAVGGGGSLVPQGRARAHNQSLPRQSRCIRVNPRGSTRGLRVKCALQLRSKRYG